MRTTTRQAGITFAVDRVTPATEPLPEVRAHEAAKLDVLLNRLVAEHTTGSGTRVERCESSLPEDLCAFYHRTNGAELFGRGEGAAVRIAALNEIQSLDWGEKPETSGGNRGPDDRIWHRLARLTDGRWLAINLDANRYSAPWREDPELCERQRKLGYEMFAPICLCSDATLNRPGANPVVALSFTELLNDLLDSGGKPAWLAPGFTGHGDAELFTRRN